MKILLAGFLVALLIVAWLRHARGAGNLGSPHAFTSVPGVALRASEVSSDVEGARTFVLTYDARQPVTRFRFHYTPKPPTGDSPFVVTRGMLEPDSGSNEALLAALAEMHGGKPVAHPDTRVAHITLDVAVLGERLARQPEKHAIALEFTDDVPGPWLVTKLFLPAASAEEEQPEIFLAIDAAAGRAELLMKDPDYWPALGERLATVL